MPWRKALWDSSLMTLGDGGTAEETLREKTWRFETTKRGKIEARKTTTVHRRLFVFLMELITIILMIRMSEQATLPDLKVIVA